MGLVLLIVLLVIPALEIFLFIELGGAIGAGWTLLLIVLTGAWGLHAMRTQGLAVLAEAQKAQSAGRPPLAAAAHGVLILLAGILLIVPGFFTDGVGFLLMLGPLRSVLLETLLAALLPAMMRGFERRAHSKNGGANRGPNRSPNPGRAPMGGQADEKMPPNNAARTPPDIIEGDYRVEDNTQDNTQDAHENSALRDDKNR